MIPEYLKDTIAFYDEHVDSYIEKTKDLIPFGMIESFEKRLPAPAKILEVGCAFGRDVPEFLKKGYDVTAIDLSEKMIEQATKHHPEAIFYVMNATDLDFEDDSFDGVYSNMALVHLKPEDLELALDELFRVTRPGGIIFFSLKEGDGSEVVKDKRYENASKFYSYVDDDELRMSLRNRGARILLFDRMEVGTQAYDVTNCLHYIVRKK